MCVFNEKNRVGVHDVMRDDPIIAWKHVKVNIYGHVLSPHQRTRWKSGKVVSFKGRKNVPELVVYTSNARWGLKVGVFAWKKQLGDGTIRRYGFVNAYAKVALWGRVIEYKRSVKRPHVQTTPAGYRAQHATILELVIPRCYGEINIERVRRENPGLAVRWTHKMKGR